LIRSHGSRTPVAAAEPSAEPARGQRPTTADARYIRDERARAATEVLEAMIADRSLLNGLPLDQRTRLLAAAGTVYEPDIEARRRQIKTERRQRKADKTRREQEALGETGIRVLRAKPVFTTPDAFAPRHAPGDEIDDDTTHAEEQRESLEPLHCYVCKQRFTSIHAFYDQMCPVCGDFNYAKRGESADLTGRVALLTGGRVKIGYQAGIKLLRAGAHLIVTTRFPRDSALRYAQEADFAEWGHRLEIFGLDLRHTPSVEAFCQHLIETRERLDFIVNNACQTVRRPPDFYRHMMQAEAASLATMPGEVHGLLGAYEGLRRHDMLPSAESDSNVRAAPAGLIGLTHAAQLSQAALLPDDLPAPGDLFPEGRLDQDLQQIDLRDRNSWRLTLAEVPSVELLETQLVNAVAPFVLNARLKPLMLRTPGREKHIVNVSAVEGQFYRRLKTTRHPHTNMAKAALNMMTRTSAADYQADGIHMNSVDTGWVSDEDPTHIAERKTAEQHFHPPLDIVDGAARIVDPIIDGINSGVHVWGQFLKDYRPTDW
jgi:NAD(P)-dependent dehydrogenase (short-subunit alcohol dehydrogenase family)